MMYKKNDLIELDKIGISSATNAIGILYCDGEIVPKDEQKKMEYYRKAAKQGFRWGYSNIADISTNEQEKQENYLKSFYLLKRLADHGWNYETGEAMEPRRKVVQYLENGLGITKNPTKSNKLKIKYAIS